jgi:hypothetical protein
MKSVLSALILIASVAIMSCSVDPGPAYLINDGFNRADSFTVGNGWSESEAGDSGKTSSVSIIGGKLVCQGGLYGTSVVFGTVYKPNMSFSTHKTTVNFKMENSSYLAVQLYDSPTPSPAGNYYQVQVGPGSIGLVELSNGGSKWLVGPNAYAFDSTHNYTLSMTYASYKFTIDITDTNTSTTTTITATNSDYQLFGTFVVGGGGYDSGSSTAYKTYIDSVTVEKL